MRRRIRNKLLRNTIVMIILCVLYYALFSWLFDTPLEHELKKSTQRLNTHLEVLNARYDTLEQVLRNLQERDSALFGIIFESTPYRSLPDAGNDIERYSQMGLSSLKDEYIEKIDYLDSIVTIQNKIIDTLLFRFASHSNDINGIPSIQPVNNPNLELLATSFGVRINPFYKKHFPHNGVDYAVSVGTAVFATADGVVSKVERNGSTTGMTITINHGNGYNTFYAYLSRVSAKVGQRVRRGDIIAFSGNSGLSYAPHLHYEVIKNGVKVNPLDYMFLEIGPNDIERFKEISSHAMQAFD